MASDHHAGLARGRRFGLEVGGGCLALALLLAWRGTHPTMRTALLVAGLVLALFALARPVMLSGIAAAWLAVGERIAAVTTPVFLTLLYLGVVTPFALLRRHVARSPIRRDRDASTFWVRRPPSTPEARRSAMEHQF